MMAKSVLITGCSSGIGAALVKSFQKRGLTVFATARNPSSLSAFLKTPNVHALALDVTSESSIEAAFEEVKIKTGGKLDYLVNNAGRGYNMPFLDYPMQEARAVFETNFWGPLRMVQVFAPLVIEAKGTIVNIGSVLGNIPGPFMSIYSASKAAIRLFSETLRQELMPLDVKVITVVTGGVASAFMANVPDVELPKDSLYHPVADNLNAMIRGDDGVDRMPCDEYAEQVARDILGGKNGVVWRGASAFLARVGNTVFPQWLCDNIMMKASGLLQMKRQPRK